MNSFDILPKVLPRSVDGQSPRDAAAAPENADANGAASEADVFGSLLNSFAEQPSGDGEKARLVDAADQSAPGPDIKNPDVLSPDIGNSVFMWLEGLLPRTAPQVAPPISGGNMSAEDPSLPLIPQDLRPFQDGAGAAASPTPSKIAVSVQHQETHFRPIVDGPVAEAFPAGEEPLEGASDPLPVDVAEKAPETVPMDRRTVRQAPLPQSPVEAAGKQDPVEQQAPVKGQAAAVPAERAEAQKPVAPSVAQNEPNGLPAATLQRLADAASSEIRSAASDSPMAGSPGERAFRTISIKASDSVLRILNLQLHPAELGAVTIKMRLAGDQLHMELHTEKEETARLLRHDSEKLSMLLRGSGYRPDAISIQVSAAGSQDQLSSQAQRQQADTQFQGQSFQQGGASQEGHARNREKQDASTRPELSRDAGEDRPLGNRHSGGVYL